jgi:bifunctional oligoribonuclease and PAP phosphatase NrnA
MTKESVVKAGPEVWQEAERLLRASSRILAFAHVSPDGDAIGSLLGFTYAMRSLGKYVQPITQDAPHPRFDYLPGLRDIRQRVDGEFDLVVALDSGDAQRLGAPFRPETHGALPMVQFDHHITNTNFAAVNVVDATVASTCELVLRLIRQMGIALTPEISASLLTGIITDTLAFRTSNTTPDTLASAMELMRHGASLMDVTRQSLVMRSWESIRLQGVGIMATQNERGVAYATITRKLRREQGIAEERGDGGLVGVLITANDVKIAAVFSELASGDIEISFRAAPGYDVSQVAVTLGGGGHPAAAGCTLPGPMRDAVNQALPLLRAAAEKR